MLGAALVFVTIFRKLKLGATLGYIVGGAVIGPYVLGLISDPQALLSVTDIGIAFLLFIVGLELHPSRLWRLRQGHFRARPGAGCAVRARTQPCSSILRSACRLAASLAIGLPLGLVVDRAGAADAALRRRPQHAAGRAGLLDPAVPGPVDRADDHDRRGDVARAAGPERAGRLDACALHVAGGRRAGPRRAAHPQSLVPADRPLRRARVVRRRRPVHGHRRRGADAQRCICRPRSAPSSPA